MKKIQIVIILLMFQFSLLAQTAKMVGYLPTGKFGLSSSIEFCKLTHLNICFANPDADGNLQMDNLSAIITESRQQNPDIKICVSMGGGAMSEKNMNIWATFIDIPENRTKMITNIIDFVDLYNLDGVDFDLEWDAVTFGYSDFVIALNDSLKYRHKIFTAALPAIYRYPFITNQALAVFDFINIMAYDETGPWTPNKPGQHSSFEFAKRAVDFWKNQGVPAEKLTLGVPFYGYNFNNQSNVFAFSFADMVDTNILYADIDYVDEAYYNGRPTIEKKVEFAAQNTSGIMIWEIAQDKFNEYSLLSTIQNKFTSMGITTTGLSENVVSANKYSDKKLRVFPNPGNKTLYIDCNLTDNLKLSVLNIFGQKLNLIPQKQFNKIELNISGLVEGIYIIRIESRGINQSEKIIIKRE